MPTPLYSFSAFPWGLLKLQKNPSVPTAEQNWKNIFTDFQLGSYDIRDRKKTIQKLAVKKNISIICYNSQMISCYYTSQDMKGCWLAQC